MASTTRDDAYYDDDDFDTYDDDGFEAYESSASDEEDNTPIVAAAKLPQKTTTKTTATNGVLGAPTFNRAAAPPDPGQKSIGTVVSVRPPSGFGRSRDYGAAPTKGLGRTGNAAANRRDTARVAAIRKLVSFDYVSSELLNLPPKSAYELSLLRAASTISGMPDQMRTCEKETQSGQDTMDSLAQTEDITVTDSVTQCPDDGSTTSLGVPKNDKKKSSRRGNTSASEWGPRLAQFVVTASNVRPFFFLVPGRNVDLTALSQVMHTILREAEDAAMDHIEDEEDIADSTLGTLCLDRVLQVPADHRVTAIGSSPSPSTTSATVIIAVATTHPATIPPQSTLALYPLQRKAHQSRGPLSPTAAVAQVSTWGVVTALATVTAPTGPASRSRGRCSVVVVAGTDDGAVVAWDGVSTHRVWASYNSQDAGGGATDPPHAGRVIGVHCAVATSSGAAMGAPPVVWTVDESGTAAAWSVVPSATGSNPNYSQVALVHLGTRDLCGRPPSLVPVRATAARIRAPPPTGGPGMAPVKVVAAASPWAPTTLLTVSYGALPSHGARAVKRVPVTGDAAPDHEGWWITSTTTGSARATDAADASVAPGRCDVTALASVLIIPAGGSATTAVVEMVVAGTNSGHVVVLVPGSARTAPRDVVVAASAARVLALTATSSAEEDAVLQCSALLAADDADNRNLRVATFKVPLPVRSAGVSSVVDLDAIAAVVPGDQSTPPRPGNNRSWTWAMGGGNITWFAVAEQPGRGVAVYRVPTPRHASTTTK
ncbi:hypothetical protein BC828DRAFT_393790 [Blastocladiella britannica]|nr:hypothetical protein BC828DRAFT_393790 [Blastocladiella britannica]